MKVKAKHVVFLMIAVATVYVMQHNERFLVDPEHPAWKHYESFKWVLLPHGIFGAIVLLFAPFQFSDRLRRRFTKAHRVMGRFYVIGALGLAPLGAYIQYHQESMGAPRSFTVLGIVDAVMLMSVTIIAFIFAFRRKIAQHKQWATRSYAVALVFIGARFFLGVTGWEALGVEIVQAVIWSCMALSVPLADFALSWKDLRSRSAASVKTTLTSKQNVPEPIVRAA